MRSINTTEKSSYQEKDRAHFTRWASFYDTGISGYFFRKSYQKALLAALPRPHQHILDLGCGTGGFMSELFTIEPTLSIIGVDYTKAMLDQAQEKFRNNPCATFLLEPAEQLSVQSQSIDMIYCIDAFHHFIDPNIALTKMRRALKPNGLMIILDPVNDKWRRPLMNIATPFLGEEHACIYSKKEWLEMFQRHAMHVEQDYSWLLFFHIFIVSIHESIDK